METILSALIMGLIIVAWDISRMFFQSWWITRQLKKEQIRQTAGKPGETCCPICCPKRSVSISEKETD